MQRKIFIMRRQISRKETHMSKTHLISIEKIEKAIYFIRGEKVMLDRDLAHLYEVETKTLNRAVKRNLQRFPLDFMFQLTEDEAEILRCQIGTSSKGHGGRRYLPYVFTEQGVAMLSSVLNSERAISVNIEIMRAFVKLRQLLASNTELARRLDKLEGKYDKQFKIVFDAIRKLMATPARDRKEIGFVRDRDG
jgi:ORF6N domain